MRDLQAVVLPTELESQRATLTSGLLPFLLRDIESAQASYFACEVETASDGPPPWTLYCSQRFDEMQELYKGAQPNTRRAKQATEARLPPDQGACSTRDPATLADAQPLVTGPVRVIVIPDLSWGYFEAPLTHVEVDEVFDAVQRFLATKYRRADFVPRKEARKAISQILASMRGEKAAPKSCAYTPSLVSGLCPLYGNLWVATVRASCSAGDCELEVVLGSAGEPIPDELPTHFIAKVSGNAGSVKPWTVAASRLVEQIPYGGAGLTPQLPKVAVEVLAVEQYQLGMGTEVLKKLLEPVANALVQCRLPAFDASSWWFVVGKRAGGVQVLRSGETMAPASERAACVEGAFAQLKTSKLSNGGRFSAQFSFGRSADEQMRDSTTNAYGVLVGKERVDLTHIGLAYRHAGDVSKRRTENLLAACWKQHGSKGSVYSIDAELKVSATGQVSDAVVKGGTQAQAGCVTTALKTLEFPCTESQREERALVQACVYTEL